jgi:3-oxoacyl-[acyl-carrier protein] reductase
MKENELLRGRVAVVTGARRGIGRVIALALAKEGAKVIVNDLEAGRPQAEQTVKEIIDGGGCAFPQLGDVTSFEQARELIQTAVAKFGRIDILVNNAGIAGHGVPWDISENDWDRMISVHLKGTFNCTRHACGLMREQKWGRIINCTSGSWISRAGGCHYAAAKAGIVGFTRAVAMDMADYPVTCNAYHPYARTDMTGPQSAVMVEKRFKAG